MSYTRLDLKNGTVVDESHVSHIEDGIEDCESQLDELSTSLGELGSTYYSSFDDLIADGTAMSTNDLRLVSMSNTVSNSLFGQSGASKGWMAKGTSNYLDFFLMLTNGSSMYAVRYSISDAATYSIYRINGTSISTTSAEPENA